MGTTTTHRNPEHNRALLLGAQTTDQSWSSEESLAELSRLADTAGIEVVGQFIQQLRQPHPVSYFGKGKIHEIRAEKGTLHFNSVITDDELNPSQQRFLEHELDVQVLDRTALILHIFAEHASTREGRLQVELAQYRYRMPRLTGRGIELSRLGAGINTRGPGETKLESDRRRIRHRMAELSRDIEQVRRQRTVHRRQRRATGLPVAAIVGYTNAGKSTLMNALTSAGVLSSDQLFATLDPTTRRLELPNHQEILLTDTVGFIQKLPTDLVAAFRATLEEIIEADVVVHVIDASHAQVDEQAEAVEDELEALGVADKPRLTVLNKVDRVTPERLVLLGRMLGEATPVSALRGDGLPALLIKLEHLVSADFVPIAVCIPYDQLDLVNLLRSRGRVDTEVHGETGTVITGKVPKALLPIFRSYVQRSPSVTQNGRLPSGRS